MASVSSIDHVMIFSLVETSVCPACMIDSGVMGLDFEGYTIC